LSVPEPPDDEEPELLLDEPDDGADELDPELELLLDPQAASASDASAPRTPIVMRRCLKIISLKWFAESVGSTGPLDVKPS
jgi:hypothetical protein